MRGRRAKNVVVSGIGGAIGDPGRRWVAAEGLRDGLKNSAEPTPTR